jgi:glyoxylase-like metal-dependent hydrolase (beta-lactamase superfamily II)
MKYLLPFIVLLVCGLAPPITARGEEGPAPVAAAGGETAPAQPVATEPAPKPTSQQPGSAPAPKPVQETFFIKDLGSNVYAAIAKIGGRASSNAMFVIGESYVVAAGAHMTKEVIQDLNAEIASRTSKPVRYFVLAHHHPGYTHVDFDFPPSQDVIMSWQAWQDMDKEIRKPAFPIIFFSEGLTLKPGGVTVVLTNLGPGHSAGDIVAFVPEAGVVFASDLLYVNSIGYMGGGYMREWVLALDFLEQFGADKIIPGTGPVSGVDEVVAFKEFFREFLTAVLARIEHGDTLEQVTKDFDMPTYRQMNGYQQLIKINLQRAYIELKEEFGH